MVPIPFQSISLADFRVMIEHLLVIMLIEFGRIHIQRVSYSDHHRDQQNVILKHVKRRWSLSCLYASSIAWEVYTWGSVKSHGNVILKQVVLYTYTGAL